MGLITRHGPLNKYLHNMGLIDEPIYIACGMEGELASLLCDCRSLISLRMRTFSKPILGVEESEGVPVLLRLIIHLFWNHVLSDLKDQNKCIETHTLLG
jgi:hypothetical protein